MFIVNIIFHFDTFDNDFKKSNINLSFSDRNMALGIDRDCSSNGQFWVKII